MKKIIDWINSHKIITVCIGLFLFIVQPLVVHWMFKTQAATPFWEKTWEAGDLLGYIAGFEAFLGTVFLGVVATRQNDKANELNERVVKLEEESCLFSRFPNIVIIGDHVEKGLFREHVDKELLAYISDNNFDIITEYEKHKDRNYSLVRFIVRNLSDFNVRVKLYKLYIEFIGSEDISYKYQSNPINFKPRKAIIAPGNELTIGFLLEDSPKIKNLGFMGVMHLFISNNIDEEFHNTTEFKGHINNESSSLFVLDQYDGKLKKGSSKLV